MQLERTLASPLPIEKVFDYMAHFHRVVEWDPTAVRAEKLTPGLITLGTRFAVDVRMWGQISSLTYSVTRIEEPRYIELRGDAGTYSVVDRITLAPDGRGGTQLHYCLEISFGATMQKIAPLFKPLIIRNADLAMEGLRRALDPSAPADIVVYPGWLDKAIVPGALQFTRFGYYWAKKRWKGLNSDLTGKRVVVTGATDGLGREAVLQLAELGAEVIAVARDEKKAQALRDAVFQQCRASIRVELADLSSLRATLLLGKKLVDEGLPIDVLVNNAGALYNERMVTQEGFEKSFALLLLSPFFLSETLMPALEKSGAGRVINVVSGGLYTQPVRLDDPNYEKSAYDGAKAYARAKRGLLDMTRHWAATRPGNKVVFHAMHPGWADTRGVAESLPGFRKLMQSVLRTPAQGADTIVWLAAAPEVARCNGGFWLDRRQHVSEVFKGTESSPEKREKLYVMLRQHLADFSAGNVRVRKPDA